MIKFIWCCHFYNSIFFLSSFKLKLHSIVKVKEFASKDKLVIGGSGCEGTALTIDMSNKMAAAGADAVMVLTPCYFKGNMSVDALVGHYNAVADACSVPVFLYNIPMATG